MMTSVVYANGFGIKLDQAVGNYIGNVDADAYSFTSGEPVNFMFQLWNKDRTEQEDFDNVWVSITPAGGLGGFANVYGGLLGKPDFGGFRMTYVFPKSGNYVLEARYGKIVAGETQTIIDTSFPITVDRGDAEALVSNPKEIILALIAGAILGAGVIFFIKKQKK